jgi:hypothetical protein
VTDFASAGVIVHAFVTNDVEGWLCNSSTMFDLQAELLTPMAMSIVSVLFGLFGFVASFFLLWRRIPVGNEDAPWQGRWAVGSIATRARNYCAVVGLGNGCTRCN